MMAAQHYIFFRPVVNCRVAIVLNGFYSECPIYENGEHLFARISQRFIKLLAGGTTSSKARWIKVYFTDEAADLQKRIVRP